MLVLDSILASLIIVLIGVIASATFGGSLLLTVLTIDYCEQAVGWNFPGYDTLGRLWVSFRNLTHKYVILRIISPVTYSLALILIYISYIAILGITPVYMYLVFIRKYPAV